MIGLPIVNIVGFFIENDPFYWTDDSGNPQLPGQLVALPGRIQSGAGVTAPVPKSFVRALALVR
jgi:hypothetical protein